MSGSRFGSRALLVSLLAATAATFVALSPVLADTELARYGRTGDGYVSEDDGGVVCSYDTVSGDLQSIFVSGPTIYARSRTSGIDSQRVGWRFLIWRQPYGSSTHQTVYKSSVYRATATDDQAPAFASHTMTPTLVPSSNYFVIIKMLWYRTNGTTVAGWQKHRVDYYTAFFPISGNRVYYNSACFSNGA